MQHSSHGGGGRHHGHHDHHHGGGGVGHHHHHHGHQCGHHNGSAKSPSGPDDGNQLVIRSKRNPSGPLPPEPRTIPDSEDNNGFVFDNRSSLGHHPTSFHSPPAASADGPVPPPPYHHHHHHHHSPHPTVGSGHGHRHQHLAAMGPGSYHTISHFQVRNALMFLMRAICSVISCRSSTSVPLISSIRRRRSR
jgi:hypothetical protein